MLPGLVWVGGAVDPGEVTGGVEVETPVRIALGLGEVTELGGGEMAGPIIESFPPTN